MTRKLLNLAKSCNCINSIHSLHHSSCKTVQFQSYNWSRGHSRTSSKLLTKLLYYYGFSYSSMPYRVLELSFATGHNEDAAAILGQFEEVATSSQPLDPQVSGREPNFTQQRHFAAAVPNHIPTPARQLVSCTGTPFAAFPSTIVSEAFLGSTDTTRQVG